MGADRHVLSGSREYGLLCAGGVHSFFPSLFGTSGTMTSAGFYFSAIVSNVGINTNFPFSLSDPFFVRLCGVLVPRLAVPCRGDSTSIHDPPCCKTAGKLGPES